MAAEPREHRSAGEHLLQALVLVAFTVLSAVLLVMIGLKLRTTLGVLEILEHRVDGMIATTSHPGRSSAGLIDLDVSRVG
jgi:hypothetical protein